MDIEYKGANCVVITHKKDQFVIDPKISQFGLKDQGAGTVAIIATQPPFSQEDIEDVLIIDRPGEYEVHNCSIKGIAARRHSDGPESPLLTTMYRLDLEDISIAVIGHIDPKLTEQQLEELGVVDLLIIPVGNHGYTLDAKSAVEVVRKIEPKIIIPTHYAEDGIKYEVPQDTAADFIKELGIIPEETTKLKLKSGALPAGTTLVKITRTK